MCTADTNTNHVPADHSPAPTPVPASPRKVRVRDKRSIKQLPDLPRVPLKQRTPLVNQLLNTARRSRASAKELRKKYMEKCKELKNLQKNLNEVALNNFRDKLDPSFMKILECQLRNAGRKKHGWRYKPSEKMVFLGMHQRGPRQYRNFPIKVRPSRKTIRELLKTLNLKPGVNPIIVDGLAARMKNEPENNKDVIIMLDEISLRTYYWYDAVNDMISGFIDLGNDDRRDLPAEDALVAMIRFVYGQGKQPIAWWNTNKKLTADDFAKIFNEILEAVTSAGLRVRAILTDSLAKNKLAMLKLGATEEYPYFFINEVKIFCIFDVPHLLKGLRNAILKYVLHLGNGQLVKFEYIKEFIEMDMKMTPRLAKKVTKTHLNPNSFEKMSVGRASQLFSDTVAVGILVYAMLGGLPHEATATGNFCAKINNLFDSWNGIEKIESPTPDQFKCALTDTSPHLKLWTEMYNDMLYWNFIGSTNLTFHINWRWSMRSVACMWEDLKKEGQDHLPVGHVNMDPLENCNSQFRLHGGHRSNPSANEFPASFGSVMINNLTTSVKGKNCRDENSLNVINLQHLYAAAKAASEREKQARATQAEENSYVLFPTQTIIEEIVEEETDLYFEDEEEEEVDDDIPPVTANSADFVSRLQQQLSEVSGAEVAIPIIDRHLKLTGNCEACKSVLQTQVQFPLHLPHTLSASGINMDKMMPSATVAKIVTDIYSSASQHIPPLAYKPKVMANFLEIVHTLTSVRQFHLCPEHNSTKTAFLKSIALTALQDFLRQLNQDVKKRNQLKKSKKLQRVSHQ